MYVANSKKNIIPSTMPVKKPFFAPSAVALVSFLLYLSTSFSSPANAKTVRMEDRTSSATAPAPAYCFCSSVVNLDVSCAGMESINVNDQESLLMKSINVND